MALTKRYVSVAGAGTNDGTSEANAMTWAQMITDINTPRVGYKYLVQSGTYANATTATTITGDGTATSPNVIEGYATTEGDLLANGRDSNGALVTTGFPVISYTGTTARWVSSGSTHLIIRNLRITSAASNPTIAITSNSTLDSCEVTNTGTNSLSSSITNGGSSGLVINCDASTASTGAAAAIINNGNETVVTGCRVKCVPGIGIQTQGRFCIQGNTVYESSIGISVSSATATGSMFGNTIANCTGDGVDLVTASTASVLIFNNHITGCGGYGIDYNTSSASRTLLNNRFRDNTSTNINGGGDWEEGTSVNNVTSDDTDATDFTDAANDNYSLLTTASAIVAGAGYRNPIGASGAGSFPSGGSGSALHLGGLGQTGIGSF